MRRLRSGPALLRVARCYDCGLVLRLPAKHRPTCVLECGEDVRPLLELC